MKLHKIKYRNPALDTKGCYCINNYLWAKDKVQIISDKEFLAPKFYAPRHVGQLHNRKLAQNRYRAKQPLKLIKAEHERKKREYKKRISNRPKTDRIYRFNVNLSADEYKLLWNYLYKEVRDPVKDRKRIQTIEEMIEKQQRKEYDKK